jgi:hypothetical protein
MTNNALLERLMGNNQGQPVSSSSNDNTANANQGNFSLAPTVVVEDEATTVRVITVKYKLYTAIILLIMGIIGVNYYPNLQKNYDNIAKQRDNFTKEIKRLEQEHTSLVADQEMMQEIVEEHDHLVKCLNEEDKAICQPLWIKRGNTDEDTINKCTQQNLTKEEESECEVTRYRRNKGLSIPVSFLQLHSLYAKNMIIDEKKILKNLNEYLIQNGFEKGYEAKNGSIRSINIGNPIVQDEKGVFFSVPISFTIVFNTQQDLVSFVHNVERKLIENPVDRILYKIQSISYDIVDSNEEQTSTMDLTAYYYYNPENETYNIVEPVDEEN